MRTGVRPARYDELETILDLYRHLNPEDEYPHRDRLREAWDRIQSNRDLFHCLVLEEGGVIVSSCSLSILPNLSRGGRSIGLIENVITHPEYRRKGFAGRVLEAAIAACWERNCYKVMLQSGVKRTAAHRLYERAGFNRNTKYGFEIRRD